MSEQFSFFPVEWIPLSSEISPGRAIPAIYPSGVETTASSLLTLYGRQQAFMEQFPLTTAIKALDWITGKCPVDLLSRTILFAQ